MPLNIMSVKNLTHKVLLIGGSGFIGRAVTKLLASKPGISVQLASRHPKAANATYTALRAKGIALPEPISMDIRNEKDVQQACTSADVVVNLVGIMNERGQNRFESVQHMGAERVARAAHATGAHLIHISTIGANPNSTIPYARTKGLGEQAIRAIHPRATILRPSIVFGPNDDFFNRLARIARYLPVMPVFGGGQTRYQPVYVGDVARAIYVCAKGGVKYTEDPESVRLGMRNADELDIYGKTIELGGPTVYTYRQLIEICLNTAQLRRPIISLPWWIGHLQGAVMERLPLNLFTITRDQVRLLQLDNKVSNSALGLMDLGIVPTALESILVTYLSPRRN
ncbi:NAD(P)-binding protein [Syncephalis plumigaleata]|nr:NAD(P)-binding protein [Syncephalis plumigaleata]